MNWNTNWKASKNPRKQRKYIRNAPLHTRNKLLGCHLSKELRQKIKRRALSIRKGDKVKIIKGQHKGKTGTVDRINTKRMRIYITGVEFTKKDGSKTMYPIRPSNLIITELQTDKRRLEEQK